MDELINKIEGFLGSLTGFTPEKRREIVDRFFQIVKKDLEEAIIDWLSGLNIILMNNKEYVIPEIDRIIVPDNQQYKWEYVNGRWQKKSNIVKMADNVSVEYSPDRMSITVKINAPHAVPVIEGWTSTGKMFVIDLELARLYGYHIDEEHIGYIDEEGKLRRGKNPSPGWTKVYVGRQTAGIQHIGKDPINDIIENYWDAKWKDDLKGIAREVGNAT